MKKSLLLFSILLLTGCNTQKDVQPIQINNEISEYEVFSIEGKEMSLPIKFEFLQDLGYISQREDKIKPGESFNTIAKKDGKIIEIILYNDTNEKQEQKDCYITQMTIHSGNNFKVKNVTFDKSAEDIAKEIKKWSQDTNDSSTYGYIEIIANGRMKYTFVFDLNNNFDYVKINLLQK